MSFYNLAHRLHWSSEHILQRCVVSQKCTWQTTESTMLLYPQSLWCENVGGIRRSVGCLPLSSALSQLPRHPLYWVCDVRPSFIPKHFVDKFEEAVFVVTGTEGVLVLPLSLLMRRMPLSLLMRRMPLSLLMRGMPLSLLTRERTMSSSRAPQTILLTLHHLMRTQHQRPLIQQRTFTCTAVGFIVYKVFCFLHISIHNSDS